MGQGMENVAFKRLPRTTKRQADEQFQGIVDSQNG